MTNRTAHPSEHQAPLHDPAVPARYLLSALWIAVMLLYVYVDILAFYVPGTIGGILAGHVWVFDITQGWALAALALMTVPALMLVLSLTLRAEAARWTNVVVASLYVPISIGSALGETWQFMWLGALVETVLLLFIVRLAWTWPRRQATLP